MKIILPEIDHVFEVKEEYVNEIVIENQRLMRTVITDLFDQINGFEGRAVLSDSDKPIRIAKSMEVLDRFVPFSINKKPLINKIASELEKKAVNPELYPDTLEILSRIEKYLLDISQEMIGDLLFDNVNIASLIKASGVSLCEEYDSLGEKIIDYFELVTEYDNSKVFILVNIRSYLDDEEMEAFVYTVCRQGYMVVLIESVEHTVIKGIKRYIIDKDLCEIG